MANKTDKKFLFEAKLNWLSEDRGIVLAHSVNGPVYVSTPTQFGGSGKDWSPEHLFLGAVSSCYMSTFLAFAKKNKFSFTHLECNVIGEVELVEGRYKFTQINVYPSIYIADESMRETANELVLKTQHYCLISNSINANIIYHTQVKTEHHPQHTFRERTEDNALSGV